MSSQKLEMNLIEDRAWRWASATNHEWAVVQPLRPTSNPLPASTWARPAAAAGLRAGGSSAPGALLSSAQRPGSGPGLCGNAGLRSEVKKWLMSTALQCKDIFTNKEKKIRRAMKGRREGKNTWPRPDRVNQLSLPTSGQMLLPCSLVTSQEWTLNCSSLFEGSEAGSGDISAGTC